MVFITTTSGAGDSGHSIASSESSTACPDVLPGHPPRGVTRPRLASLLRAPRTSLNARTRDLPNLHGISDLARDVLAREGLQPPHSATMVSVRDGNRPVHDGPNAATKEFLGGFVIIDVPDLDAALEWAARNPAAA